jgi:GTPase SAR1 family protein
MESNPPIEKVILLGDTSTGKSSFLKNYMSNYRTKVGVPTSNFECLTALNANPRKYLQIWDTPGREKFRLMPMAMIGSYHYCLVFYDITSRHSYDVAKTIVESTHSLNQMSFSATIESR